MGTSHFLSTSSSLLKCTAVKEALNRPSIKIVTWNWFEDSLLKKNKQPSAGEYLIKNHVRKRVAKKKARTIERKESCSNRGMSGQFLTHIARSLASKLCPFAAINRHSLVLLAYAEVT